MLTITRRAARTSRAVRQRARHLRLEVLEQLRDRQVTTLAASPDAYESLTAREREVLLLAAQGLTNPEIGTCLGISRRTAETHRDSKGSSITYSGVDFSTSRCYVTVELDTQTVP